MQCTDTTTRPPHSVRPEDKALSAEEANLVIAHTSRPFMHTNRRSRTFDAFSENRAIGIGQ